jgi:hypothetical protein
MFLRRLARWPDSFTASAGTSVAFGKTVAIGSYDYSEASSPFAKDAS